MLLLPETLTLREATDTVRMLTQALRNGGDGDTVVIDASGLQRFDSAALAVLLECGRLAKAWGKRYRVDNLPTSLAALAKLYGLDALLLPAA